MKSRYGFVLIATMVTATTVLSSCTAASVPPLPSPPTVAVAPTSTSVPDYSGTSIPKASGSTTTSPVQIRGGGAVLQGRVLLGGAPVGGAGVHIDRFEGAGTSGLDTTTQPDGTYRFDGLLGGRFRIRAYRPPDATMNAAQVFFLNVNETRSIDLNVSSYSGGPANIAAAIAPNPPVLGELANVAVAVTTRGVDSSGVARSIGIPNVWITLVAGSGRSIVPPAAVITDGNGRARFQLRCASLDNQQLTIVLPDGTAEPLNLAACQLPPPTTTTIPAGSLTPLSVAPVPTTRR